MILMCMHESNYNYIEKLKKGMNQNICKEIFFTCLVHFNFSFTELPKNFALVVRTRQLLTL